MHIACTLLHVMWPDITAFCGITRTRSGAKVIKQIVAVCSEYLSCSSHASDSLSAEVKRGISASKSHVQETCRHYISMKPKELSPDGIMSRVMLLSSSDMLPAHTVRPRFVTCIHRKAKICGITGDDRQRHCCEAC